ncbi:MAG: helix-turn-helix domain-containing protein [Curvibacter sp.]|nr:MAG: helix-turn-helix domain-containing protein [Curvibacter sp.]
MQDISQSEIIESLQKLRLLVKSRVLTQADIALATNVDQSQVSRILAGQIRRVSANVLELCKFANSYDGGVRRDPSQNEVLIGALRAVWDGSSAHAEAIASVLLSLRKFKEVS